MNAGNDEKETENIIDAEKDKAKKTYLLAQITMPRVASDPRILMTDFSLRV